MQRILLIDGHALSYRSFYAVADLRNSRGLPTNAVFGFVNILRKILKRYTPDFVGACFDTGKATFRREKFADYKIQRPPMPEGLIEQIPLIKDVLRAYGIPVYEMQGYEADDLIATLVTRFNTLGHDIIIASDDKDMQQLLSQQVSLYNSRRDALLTPEDTRVRFGVGPEGVVDYLALAGDASDNIPGVPGVGDVTAQKLLIKFGSLDAILARSAEIKGKLREKIEQGRQSALLSRELAKLDQTVPLDCTIDDLRFGRMNRAALSILFSNFEFRRLADEFSSAEIPSVSVQAQFSPINDGGHDAAQCTEIALLTGFVAILPATKNDTEGRKIFEYILVSTGDVVFKFIPEELQSLETIWTSPNIIKCIYDTKPFIKIISSAGLMLKGPVFDAMLAGYLLQSGLSDFSISALAHAYLNITIPDEAEKISHHVSVLEKLYGMLQAALTNHNLTRLFESIEMPLSTVLAGMENVGVKLDVSILEVLSRECEQRINAMTGSLYALAGGEFNLNSPKQLGIVLFEKLALPVIKKTKTGPSTDEEVLSRLAPMHELPALILEYRQLSKLRSTYLEALPRLIDQDGRIRCSFNQAGTETGRLSADHPNLQNIPVKTDIGRAIRKAFIPSSNRHVLLSADYSQIELRFLAHLSGDERLIDAFTKGEDVHTYTAALIFDVPQHFVTDEMRYRAKRINFGIIYGMSAFGLAKDLNVPQREAQDFIDRYFLRYPAIQSFMAACESAASASGFAVTMFGRRRYIPEINSHNTAVRQFAARQAVNTPVQGAAADLIKSAMVAVHRLLKEKDFSANMVMTVHDELVFDVPENEISYLAHEVKHVMETTVTLLVPVEVTLKVGSNWAEMKKI
ncbi:MAG: DNA polymerase I [Candidatus Omnitrophota bacterium]